MLPLSVITINLNNVDGLQKTIESVVSQKYRDFEWIVIDGGSTDGSKALIEQYADRFSYWVSEPDKGIYHAMNKGIGASKGDYLLFLNSGDYLYDNEVLSKAVPKLQGKDFYIGDELHDQLHVSCGISTNVQLYLTLMNASFPHQSTFINRNVFHKYGYYREDLRCVSDWYLFYKAIILGTATFDKLCFVVSVFDMNGISQSELADSEREAVFSEIPHVVRSIRFYYENWEIVQALKANRCCFLLFRVYYYFYRRWKHSRRNQS